MTEAIDNVSELNDKNEPILNVCGKTYKVLAPEVILPAFVLSTADLL